MKGNDSHCCHEFRHPLQQVPLETHSKDSATLGGRVIWLQVAIRR